MNSATSLSDLVTTLDTELRTAEIPDSDMALNGLQVANRGEVHRVAVAVDASLAAIQAAAQMKADLLVVHHGLFWSGVQRLVGKSWERMHSLIQHDIAVYSAHIPLDLHATLGNNVLLAKRLGLEPSASFARYKSVDIGVRGMTNRSTATLAHRLSAYAAEYGGTIRTSIPVDGRVCRHWAICSGMGASSDTLREAREAGVDTLIVGEGSHHTAVDSAEHDICVNYAGHYATETLGVQAVGEFLQQKFGLPLVVPVAANWIVNMPDAGTAVLSLEGMSHRFGNVVALEGASLQVRPGTVHALLGENGAGKTTLMRAAFGLLHADSGVIRVNDVQRRFRSPADALAAGLGMVHQHFTLVPAMTVAENVALGNSGLYDPDKARTRVLDIARRTGLEIDPRAYVGELSVSAQQRTEIIKALARDASILILDEPTAVLAPAEAQELLRWMRAFADSGHAVILITHKLRDALAVADDFTVIRHGRTMLTTHAKNATEQSLASAMLGEDRPASLNDTQLARANIGESTVTISTRAASVRDAHGVERLRPVTLEVRRGEIVGIAAVEGAGQRELLRVLAGRLTPTSGDVTTPEKVGFIPEDRHADALMLDAPIVDNVALRDAGSRRGRLSWPALRVLARQVIDQLHVRVANEMALARMLSGGNQQKVVVGRELMNAPVALIAENPTRGLDFRTSEAVHEALRNAKATGTSVVLYSSDLDEVLALADRVLVMHQGNVTEVANDREVVGRAMLGATVERS